MTTPLPLLDFVEIGCEFPPGIELKEKLELPTEDVVDQVEEGVTAQPAKGAEQVILDPIVKNAPNAID